MRRESSLAVVGAGWAGLAAAVRATEAGARVSVFEMSPSPGGRARSVERGGELVDNGQHILIGAYRRCLALMSTIGVDEASAFARLPLALVDAQGRGLRLPAGSPLASFARGVAGHPAWSWRDKLSLLGHAARWAAGGFAVDPDRPVSQWCAALPAAVRRELIEPLCVAALNTEASQASARVFLRVLRDGLFTGRGGADLLLPRVALGDLFPAPALAWLRGRGAAIRLGRRVMAIGREGGAWLVDGQPFDSVVLACSAREAARLTQPTDGTWAGTAARFAYEPIVTAWLDAPALRAPFPMIALAGEPAQFAFDLGHLHPAWTGRMTLVASGARRWVEAGAAAFETALGEQIGRELAPLLPAGFRIVATTTEKRATFRCTPGLVRPRQVIAPGLTAAGDYVAGPYPATLEGAVRSGEAAVEMARRTGPGT